MGERRRKSRKRSDASSTSRQPEPVFLIDHNLGTRLVPEALRHAGATVEVLTDHFDSSTDDKELLAAVGAREWVFLSKDRNIRRRTLERQALMDAEVKAFLLAAADLSGDEQAAVLVKALPRISAHLPTARSIHRQHHGDWQRDRRRGTAEACTCRQTLGELIHLRSSNDAVPPATSLDSARVRISVR